MEGHDPHDKPPAGAPHDSPSACGADRHPASEARRAALDRLGDEIAELAAHLDAATARLLELLRRFDAETGWSGFRSCAEWLAWRTGLEPGAARERVRVARALGTLPLLAQAFAGGELSYAKVRALTRVATADTEARLLKVGRSGTAHHVERIVRAWRTVDRHAERRDSARRHAHRALHVHHDEDGSVILRGRLEPEVGALLLRALAAARDACDPRPRRTFVGATDAPGVLLPPLNDGAVTASPPASTTAAPDAATAPAGEAAAKVDLTASLPGAIAHDGPATRDRGACHDPGMPSPSTQAAPDLGVCDRAAEPPSFAQQNADALALLLETALHHGLDPGAPAERYQVVIHVDAPVLADPAAEGNAASEAGFRVPAGTSQRLACDASRVLMRHDEAGRIVEVGARTRTIPPAIRRALEHRDRGCRFPGCQSPFAEGHHLVHWAAGGPTTLSNLALLCRRHHRAVHEDGYALARLPDGTLRFRRPDGRPLPDVPEPPPVPRDPGSALRERHRAQGLSIHPRSLRPTWLGERIDIGWAIGVLHPRAAPPPWPAARSDPAPSPGRDPAS